jgi:adhesin/invasin
MKNKPHYYLFVFLTLLAFNTSSAEGLKSTASTILDKTFNLVQSTINTTLNIFADRYDGDGNTEISIADNDGTSFGVTTVQPISQTVDKSDTLFFQGSLHSFKNHGQTRPTINLGVGKRWLSPDKTTITGANFFYDHEFKSNHSRASIGGEYKNSAFETNANSYWGLSSKRGVTINGNTIQEEVLDGWDINVKGQVPYYPWAKITSNYYKWDKSSGSDIKGGKVGIELQLNSALTLNAGIQDDNEMSSSSFFELNYQLGVDNKPTSFARDSVAFRGGQDMTEHLLDKVERQNKIITSRGTTATMTVVRR